MKLNQVTKIRTYFVNPIDQASYLMSSTIQAISPEVAACLYFKGSKAALLPFITEKNPYDRNIWIISVAWDLGQNFKSNPTLFWVRIID